MAQPHAGLKITVISLGIVLLGGIAVLAGAVYSKVQHKAAADSICEPQAYRYAAMDDIVQMKHEEDVILLTIQKNSGGYQLVTLDPCSGKPIKDITIEKMQLKG